jgi:hypothetical protein
MSSLKSIPAFVLSLIMILPTVMLLPIVSSEPAIPPCDNSDPTVIDLIQQINESRVLSYFEHLLSFGVRYTGTSNCTQAGQWIYDEFQAMGLETAFHDWSCEGFTSRNVVATLPGTDPSSTAIYIMCAHYDTVLTSPGANDDGSGIVAMLAIAEVCSRLSFNHTIRFIAFSGEEVGTYGSYMYAQEAYSREDNIVGVLNIDIVGYAETTEGGNILRFSHEERSSWLVEFASVVSQIYREYVDLSIEDIPNYPGADNQAFVDYGYDGTWIAQHDPNRVGHSPDDTLDHINMTYQLKVTQLLLAVLVELAQKPIFIQVILTAPLEGQLYIKGKPFFSLPFGNLYFLRLRGITMMLGRALAEAQVLCKDDVKQVIFSIDGCFVSWISDPPYQWNIQGKYYPLFGRHTLKVFAYSTTGYRATDEMDIIFLTMSYQYGKW